MKITDNMTPEIMYGCFRKMCQDCETYDDFDLLRAWVVTAYSHDQVNTAEYEEMLGILQLYLMNYSKWFA